jgi:hypothetical protein
VPHHPSAFGLTAKYNDFLFTPISEQANGMQLSVLSALARMNVDPWEEAARLATMSPGEAEWALVATLSKVPGRTWSLSDAEGIAKRLVQRLPHATYVAPNAGIEAKRDGARLISFWLMWFGFFLAISLFQPRHHLTTASSGAAPSNNGTSALLKSDGVIKIPPLMNDRLREE